MSAAYLLSVNILSGLNATQYLRATATLGAFAGLLLNSIRRLAMMSSRDVSFHRLNANVTADHLTSLTAFRLTAPVVLCAFVKRHVWTLLRHASLFVGVVVMTSRSKFRRRQPQRPS